MYQRDFYYPQQSLNKTIDKKIPAVWQCWVQHSSPHFSGLKSVSEELCVKKGMLMSTAAVLTLLTVRAD